MSIYLEKFLFYIKCKYQTVFMAGIEIDSIRFIF